MSTVPPAVNVQAARQDLHKISVYIKAHETLIIVALFAAIGLHFYNAGLSAWETYAKGKDTLAHEALQAQNDKDRAVAQANAAQAAQYQALAEKLAEANTKLAQAQTQRNVTTVTQQQTDRTLTSPELAGRWESLLSLTPGTVTPQASGMAITESGAVSTVVALEENPTLKADLKDEQTLAANQKTQITNLSGLNSGLHTEIDGLHTAATKADETCEADKKLLRAQNRKRNLKYMIFGGVVVEAIRIYLTHRP